MGRGRNTNWPVLKQKKLDVYKKIKKKIHEHNGEAQMLHHRFRLGLLFVFLPFFFFFL
jgi:hypothetical protein